MASQQTEQTQEQQETPPQDGAVPESADAQTPPHDVPAPDTAPGIAPETAPQVGDAVETASGFQASDILDKVKDTAMKIWTQIVEWLTSPAFLVMVAVVILGYFLARLVAKNLRKRVDFFREEPKSGKLLRVKKIGWQLRDLIFPAALITIYAIASPALKGVPMLGQDWLIKIAQGLAVVFLLYTAIKRFVKHPIVQKLVIWIAIPMAVLKVFGWYEGFQKFLMEDAVLELGNIKIPAWSIMNLLILAVFYFGLAEFLTAKAKRLSIAKKA